MSRPDERPDALPGDDEGGSSPEADRWERVQELFGEALERDGDERTKYLDANCEDDEIRAEVESLIE